MVYNPYLNNQNAYSVQVYNGGEQAPPLSENQQADLYIRQMMAYTHASTQANAQIAVENTRFYNNRQMLWEKEQSDRRKEEAREKRKLRWEGSVVYPMLDATGRLCLAREFPDGVISPGKPIFAHPFLEITKIKDAEKGKLLAYAISWENIDDIIYIDAAKFGSGTFLNSLMRKGYPMSISHNRRKAVGEMIAGFLCNRAKEVYVATHYGWYKTPSGWQFSEHTWKKGGE